MPLTYYAQKISALYHYKITLKHEILTMCFRFARCDNRINNEEIKALRHIAELFHLDNKEPGTLLRSYILPNTGNPYDILGIDSRTPLPLIKKAYYQKMRENHPDYFMTETIDAELSNLHTEYCALITQAYHYLLHKHKKNTVITYLVLPFSIRIIFLNSSASTCVLETEELEVEALLFFNTSNASASNDCTSFLFSRGKFEFFFYSFHMKSRL